jgi:hypothetical protein
MRVKLIFNLFLRRLEHWYAFAEDLEAADDFLLWDWLLLSR